MWTYVYPLHPIYFLAATTVLSISMFLRETAEFKHSLSSLPKETPRLLNLATTSEFEKEVKDVPIDSRFFFVAIHAALSSVCSSYFAVVLLPRCTAKLTFLFNSRWFPSLASDPGSASVIDAWITGSEVAGASGSTGAAQSSASAAPELEPLSVSFEKTSCRAEGVRLVEPTWARPAAAGTGDTAWPTATSTCPDCHPHPAACQTPQEPVPAAQGQR